MEHNVHRLRLVYPVADVYTDPNHTAPVDTQVLFGEEVFFLGQHQSNGYVKIRTQVDHKVGWVRNALIEFKVAQSLHRPTHRVKEVCTLVFPSPGYKGIHLGAISMNSPVTVLQTLWEGDREYSEIAHFMSGTAWVRSSALRPTHEHASDFVEVAELFVGRQYGWGRRDANPGIDCSAILHHSQLAAGRRACARDSGEQAKSVGIREETPLRELQRGNLVFMPGHVVIMRDSRSCIHATERDPYNKVLIQTLEQVLDDRRAAGESCELTIRRFPDYSRQRLRAA